MLYWLPRMKDCVQIMFFMFKKSALFVMKAQISASNCFKWRTNVTSTVCTGRGRRTCHQSHLVYINGIKWKELHDCIDAIKLACLLLAWRQALRLIPLEHWMVLIGPMEQSDTVSVWKCEEIRTCNNIKWWTGYCTCWNPHPVCLMVLVLIQSPLPQLFFYFKHGDFGTRCLVIFRMALCVKWQNLFSLGEISKSLLEIRKHACHIA